MTTKERVLLGMVAGLVSVLSKFLAQDYDYVVANASLLTSDQLLSYKVGYGILTPALMLMGAFIAWVSEEPNRMKVVALAISAPALITTWAGGQKINSFEESVSIAVISAAYAQSPLSIDDSVNYDDPNKVQDDGFLDRVQKGVGIFFGYGKQPIRFRVVVGSFINKNDAQLYASSIKKEAPELNVRVERRPGNKYFGVIVGEYNYLSTANEIRKSTLQLQTVNEAFLSKEY